MDKYGVYMCQLNGCDSKKISWQHEVNTTDAEIINGLYGNYNDNGFIIYLHPNMFNRTEFNLFLDGIRDITLNDSGCKIIIVDLNVYHCQNKALIKISILFEFSTLGDNNISFKTQVNRFVIIKLYLANRYTA